MVSAPVGLRGLVTHPSGSIVGFSGNILYFSEPYQPHAFPPAYQLATDYEIVGLAVYGSEILVATRGNPYVASGTEPGSMTMEKTGAPYPCLAKRSVIPVGNGGLYASGHGLIFIGQGGFRIFTDSLYTKDEWAELNPDSMFAEFTNGKVYVGYTDTDGNSGVLILEPNGEGVEETKSDIACSELYADSATGILYVSDDDGVSAWDSDAANPLPLNWRSKEFTLATPVNFGAAKVEFDQILTDAEIAAIVAAQVAATGTNTTLLATKRIGGVLNGNTLNKITVNGSLMTPVPEDPPSNTVLFTLYRGDVVIYTKTVSSERPFRLPAGLKYDHFSIEVVSQDVVRSILIGETITSLKGV